jgi:hypothetical protein
MPKDIIHSEIPFHMFSFFYFLLFFIDPVDVHALIFRVPPEYPVITDEIRGGFQICFHVHHATWYHPFGPERAGRHSPAMSPISGSNTRCAFISS